MNRPVFLNLSMCQHAPEDLLRYRLVASPRASDLAGLGWGLRNCISSPPPVSLRNTGQTELYVCEVSDVMI